MRAESWPARGSVLAPWWRCDPCPFSSWQVPLQPHGLLERLVRAHPHDHSSRLHLRRRPPGTWGCLRGQVALSPGEGRPGLRWADGGARPGLRRAAGFSPGCWGLVPSSGEVLSLCPLLACSPPPPWSIPLVGPTADFLFQELPQTQVSPQAGLGHPGGQG